MSALGAPTGASAPSSLSAPAKFYTTSFHKQMPDQVFTIPTTALPAALSEIINTMLALDPPIPFDFLIGEEYVMTTLDKFMRRRGLSTEEIMHIEYTPALQAKEGNKLPHDDWVASVRAPFNGDANFLITGSYDNCVRVWSGEECLAVGAGHSEAVKEVAFHPVPVDMPSEVKKAGKKRAQSEVGSNVAFASASMDGSVRTWVYDATTSKIKATGVIRQNIGAVDTVTISPDGRLLACGSWDKTVKVFDWSVAVDTVADPMKKQPIASLSDHARSVLSVRFSPSQRNVLYSTGLDGSVKIWDAQNAQLMGTLAGEHAVQSLTVKPASNSADYLLTGCTDNKIRMYDTRQKGAVKTFSGHRQWVYGVTWMWREEEQGGAPAGENLFASSSEDATVRVWDLRCVSAPLMVKDMLHTDGVLDVTYCGKNEVASCGKDNRTKSFSVEKNFE